ncbi:MAG: AMP-binding protein [Campylobacterales bacterium]|nr:AMP-binding protein [Campylobacterales bacterium]
MQLLRYFINLLFRVTVHGKAEISPNTLIVANHESFIDGLILGANLPGAIFVVHTSVLKSHLFRFALKFVEHVAVDTTSPMAMRKIIHVIKDRPVVIFPEGRITDTGSLMKIYGGAAFVAAKTAARVIPVRLNGPSFSYFARASLPKMLLPKIDMYITDETRIDMPQNVAGHEARKICGERLKEIMQSMLFKTAKMDHLFNMFLETMDIYGDKNFVEDHNLTEASYSGVLRIANAAGIILNRYTAQKEVIGLILPNIIPTLGIILGITKEGRIPAMLNYTSGLKNIRLCCNSVNMKSIVTSRIFLEKAGLDLSSLGLNLIYIEDLRKELTFGDKICVFLKTRFPRKVKQITDELVVLFTSGSEGAPKAVVHTHSSIISNAAQVRAVADFHCEDKFFVALPTFHSFGFTCGCVLPIIAGSKIFLYPNPLHYKIIPELVYDKNCTVLFGTSTFLLNYGKNADQYDFFKVRYVVAGAEKLSEQTRMLWMEKFGIRIMEGYGATETAPVISVNTPMSSMIGSVGKILPGMEHAVEKVEGVDTGGILHVKGPNIMKGYIKAHNPGVVEHTESEFGKGWYSTGDIVEIRDGYVFIKGRLKRFAKVAGEMISLEAVENFVKTVSPDAMHAVIAEPSENKGEALVLFTTDKNITNEILLTKARETGYSEIGIPKKRVFIDSIPLLGTGKTDYVTLKDTYVS